MKNLVAVLLATVFFFAHMAVALVPNEWEFRQTIEVPAPGFNRLEIPVETLDVARPDLSDLRLLDATGQEVPFVIDQPQPRPESSLRPKSFRAEIVPPETHVIITTGTDGPLTGVTIEVSGDASFIKAAQVQGSRDQLEWVPLISGAPIFRERNGAANLRISFAEQSWPFLRIVLDDRRAEPIPITGARVHVGGSPPPATATPVVIKSRDENPGVSRLALDLGAANLRIASLRVETAEPLFTRRVGIAIPQLSGDELQEKKIATGIIYRVDLDGKTGARLDLPIEEKIPGRELILLVENDDSPPLEISAVSANRRLVRVVFFARGAGPYLLLSGNSQCALPRYDLTGLGDQLRNLASASEPRVSALSHNSEYVQKLPAGALKAAKIDVAPWKFRKPIQIQKVGVQSLELDPDVLARSAMNFSDVRIVSDGEQLPFLIERTSIARQIPLLPTAIADRERPTLSRWSLKLPQANLPVTRIACASNSPLFERSFRLGEELADERGEKYQRELGGATWRRVPNQTSHDFFLQLDTTAKSDTLLLGTDNGDNPPIELHDFRGYHFATRLVFAAPAKSEKAVWLYYGNSEAGAPRYDLNLIAEPLLRARREIALPGAPESLQSRSERVTESLSGYSRYLFFGVLGIVVIALLVLIARLLPKTK